MNSVLFLVLDIKTKSKKANGKYDTAVGKRLRRSEDMRLKASETIDV
ncbi:MAG: hypothetical protein JHC31_01230 [Sulfurihydrogenibium sp.]|jgi:hypothetical protein|nr:hypothetical protein [Sulfurihydrogenibium sp.]